MSYHHMGSIASQTSLTGTYDQNGLLGNSKSKKGQRVRLPKIKSSPGGGVLEAAKADKHGHKRGKSTSATPTSPTFVPDYLLQTTGSTLPTAHAEPPKLRKKRSRTKIKRFQQKQSDDETTPIDLSRSAAENEGLAAVYRSTSDRHRSPHVRNESGSTRYKGGSGGHHHRTTSGTSQISSTASNSSRYVHPMRQIPRPYTPPIANSYKTSLESDSTTTTPPLGTPHNEGFDQTTTSTSFVPLPTNTPPATGMRRPKLPTPLHIRTGSGSRLTSNSQTNLPDTPSSLRLQHNPSGSKDLTFPPPDVVSPVSNTARSSFETSSLRSHSRPLRSRSNTAQTPISPAETAATVAALRHQFQEKEAKKERKYAEAEARVAEKEARKREKREGKAEIRNERRRREDERRRVDAAAASEKSSVVNFGGGLTDAESSVSGSFPFPSLSTSQPLISDTHHGRSHGPVQGGSYGIYDTPRLYPSRSRGTSSSAARHGNAGEHPSPSAVGAHDFGYIGGGPGNASVSGGGGKKTKAARKRGDSKGEKVQSQWTLFWFKFRTFWLKIRRKMGGSGSG